MANVLEVLEETTTVGNVWSIRSAQNYVIGDEFAWAGASHRVIHKRPDEEGRFNRRWPWRHVYTFRVIASEELPYLKQGTV